MMAGDFSAGTFAVLTASAAAGGPSATVPFEVAPGDLASGRPQGRVLLSLEASTPDGGPVRLAGPITATTARGSRPIASLRAGEDGLLAILSAGRFQVKATGLEPGEEVRVEVALAGDVDGNFRVGEADLNAIASALGTRAGGAGYSAAADVNRDGRVSFADLTLARRNRGATTAVRPLSGSLGVADAHDPQGDGLVDLSTVDLVGLAAPGAPVRLQGGAVDRTTVADASGQYRFEAVPLAAGANTFTTSTAGAFGQTAPAALSVFRVDSTASAIAAQQRMAKFGLTDIQGLCYTPEPSDDTPQPPAAYFDSDFWNSGFTPMWSSAKNIPGFKSNGRPVDGRGDLDSMQALGVNFLHIYDWNFARDHTSFLATAKADGITVNVPVSNYIFSLSMNAPLSPGTYQYQYETVQQIFKQVYPNLGRGDTTPNPAITMWTIANEPDNSGNTITQGMVAQIAQMIVNLENQANIPDGNRLPIAVPLSWSTSPWPGYSNPTPSVAAVQALFDAFGATAQFPATGIGGVQTTIPALPSDFFTTRFVWANNPVGNDNAAFLGLQQNPPYTPYNRPGGGASPQVGWANIPMFFTEDGPSSLQPGSSPQMQAQILQQELSEVQQARSNGQNPNFNGVAVFQSHDQVTHKTGAESGFGIQTFQVNGGNFVFQTITDVPPTVVPPGGAGVWRLDAVVPKPAFNVVKQAFKR
jgi:hypothetical protein